MSRVFNYVLGPELYWTTVCLLVHLASRRSLPPTPAVTSWLDAHWAWLPFVLAPLTFAFLFLPGAGRWWLLLRIDLAIFVGLFWAAGLLANGMVYHQPSAGPGAGSAFIVIPIFGYTFAAILTLIACAVFWWQSRGAA